MTVQEPTMHYTVALSTEERNIIKNALPILKNLTNTMSKYSCESLFLDTEDYCLDELERMIYFLSDFANESNFLIEK